MKTERAAAELAEGVITAGKRTGILETMLPTIEVLNAKDIEAQSVAPTSDLARCVPSLTFTSAHGVGGFCCCTRAMVPIASTQSTLELLVDRLHAEVGTSIDGAVRDDERIKVTAGPRRRHSGYGAAGVSQDAG